ncbi:MAG TPA: hypothetical protein VMT34_05475 [Aggregatilineales bacterium]|nr:hypothetical protein [Aggregatilineales bacterium]
MRVRIALLACLFILLILPLPMHGDDGDCSTTPSVRLALGVTARVTFRGGAGAVVYEYPGTRFRPVATLADGAMVRVSAGPTCSGTSQWWRVTTASGADGWVDEGDASQYKLEPWLDVLDLPARTSTGVEIRRITADDAIAYPITTFALKPLPGSAKTVFPAAESDPLDHLIHDDVARCPDVIHASDPAFANVRTLEDLPADNGALDTYPAPDGSALLVVHHLWRSVVDCGARPSALYGLDRLALVTPSGERVLADFPANSAPPPYLDRFDGSALIDSPHSAVIAVGWSPDDRHAWLLVSYTDSADPSIRLYRAMIADLDTGKRIDLGDGLRPAWSLTGDRVQWFRLIRGSDGFTRQALYSAAPDGSDLRTIPLPERVTFVQAQEPVEGRLPPWNATGTQLVGCAQTRASGCSMLVVYDLLARQSSSVLSIGTDVQTLAWLNDSTLIAMTGGLSLTVLPTDGSPVTTLALPAMPQTIRPFADGKTILIDAGRGALYVADVKTGRVTPVHSN